jgi:ubiquinone/menaquinone biosynthesis C-methylase UbiE
MSYGCKRGSHEKGNKAMDEQQRREMLKTTFDTVAEGYDNEALRFFPASADHMARLLGLRGKEHVLDVACGTGHASIALARMLPWGKVTAVDFSPGMLEQARKKAMLLGIENIEFVESDMTALAFSQGMFDAAVCAFGIFFVEDMGRQLEHIASVVRPGGRVMISSFQEAYFKPLKELFFTRIAEYGVPAHPQAWRRIASETGCRAFFEEAGLNDVRVETKNVGYHLNRAGEWWDIVWNAGLRRMVTQLKPEDQVRFKREHLQEVETLKTEKGIWLDVGVLYTSGTKQ